MAKQPPPVFVKQTRTAHCERDAQRILPATDTSQGIVSLTQIAEISKMNPGPPPPKPITKILQVSTADGFSKAFTWDTPFTGPYTVTFGVFQTPATAGSIVSIDPASFGPGGFTVQFSGEFDGEIHFQAVPL